MMKESVKAPTKGASTHNKTYNENDSNGIKHYTSFRY